MDLLEKLEKTFNELLAGKITSEDAVSVMKEKDVNKQLMAYIYGGYQAKEGPIDDYDIQCMSRMVDILQFIYNDSGVEPPISDPEYDKLYELMVYAGGDETVGYKMPEGAETHHHKYTVLRGTLSKVYYLSRDEKRTNPSRKYLDEWIESKERDIYEKTGKKVKLNEEEVYIFPKWDGVSAIQECAPNGKMELALTRGDTEKNIAYDIGRHLTATIPTSGLTTDKPHGVKYEVMMKNDELEKYNERYMTDYKSTRSIVSSIVNSLDCDERDELIKPIPLRYIEEGEEIEKLHPKVFEYPYLKCRLKDREAIREFALSHKSVKGLRCDGAVIYIIDPKLQKILGRSDDKNNFEVAYKFTEEVAKSKIVGMDFSVKTFGRITPIAIFKPVKMKGNTVSRATIGSKARFDELNLAIGDEVTVHYDIIPYITVDPDCDRVNKQVIEFPECCPVCGERLNWELGDVIVKCRNPECPSREEGRIINYLKKMRIKNISYSKVNLLRKLGYLDSIKDLYKLNKRRFELTQIPGLGAVSVDDMIANIDARRTVTEPELFGALGIEGCSTKVFMNILQTFTVDELLDIAKDENVHKLCTLDGIKEATAYKVIDGIQHSMKLIKFLLKELDVESANAEPPKFTVCFTKIRDEALEDLIESLGGAIDDALTKSTTALIVPSFDTQSTKVDKARKYGIQVVPYSQAEEWIKAHGK